jgi:GntR family transcriptional regulator, transcriptional repressor for pyruvate dehydrogenase complex
LILAPSGQTIHVADSLAQRITGALKPGDRLASEAELAQEFAVSRVTVREAIKMLAGRGLLTVSRGRRAEVRQPDGSAYGDFLTSLIKSDPRYLFDLIHVRRALEIQSVEFAAKNASRAGLAAIEAALTAMRTAARECQDDGNDREAAELRFVQADVSFHEAMALAGGNRVLTFLFEAMAAPLTEAFIASGRGQRLRGTDMAGGLAAHERIFRHVANGDAEQASIAMKELLDDAERDLLAVYGNLGSK